MDPNQTNNQPTQDLMLPPADSLMTVDPTPGSALQPDQTAKISEEVSYTPPQAWGADLTAAPMTPPMTPLPTSLETLPETPSSWTTPPAETPNLQTTPLVPPMSPPSLPEPTTNNLEPTSSVGRTLLVGLALILLGILLGVLAARFLPMSSGADLTPLEPSTEPTSSLNTDNTAFPTGQITPTVEVTPIPTPTATPSALLNLKWNMMTVKSPVSFFNSYRIYYPTTWSIKEYKNASRANDEGSSNLTLTKGTVSINILQSAGDASGCLFPGEPDRDGMFTRYDNFLSLTKSDTLTWRWAEALPTETPAIYRVCENKTNGSYVASTAIGHISITGTADTPNLDEINYILEKIVILK